MTLRIIRLVFALALFLTPTFVLALNSPFSPDVLKYLNQMNTAALQIAARNRVVKPMHYNGSCPILPTNLSFGMRGTDVKALQTFLVTQKYLSSDTATGYFGSLTERALKTFQLVHLIVMSGSAQITGFGAAGPKTRAVIASLCIPSQTTYAMQQASSSVPAPSPQVVVQIPAAVEQSSTTLPPTPPSSTTPAPANVNADTTSNTPTDASTTNTGTPDSQTTLPASFQVCGSLDAAHVVPDQGFSYVFNDFVPDGDTSENPDISKVVVYENGLLVGPPDSAIGDVRTVGNGSFLHSSEGGVNTLYFSTSDNSNPLTNGKSYSWGVSDGDCPAFGMISPHHVTSQLALSIEALQSLVASLAQLIRAMR